ncbi:MAG: glutamine synthetase [Solirubrobacterales bacterium]|nr:glutamine synthetase [Solirubrobacterales bacterium]
MNESEGRTVVTAGDSPSDEVAIEDLERNLRERGVALVRVIHADLFGKARSKQFPVSELETLLGGVGYCKASVVESIGGVPLEGGRFPADLGFPDMVSIPDRHSIRVVPWEPDTAWVLADLAEHGEPSELCCRSALRVACERLAENGLEAIIAPEAEFYLFEETDEGVKPYSPGVGMAYTAGRRADPGGILGRLHRQLIELGIEVTAANREFSPGQFELNLKHESAMRGADNAFLFKEAVKELALDQGMIATFMAMPFAEHSGSSCHLHISLWEDGRNLFLDDDGEVSELCHGFIGGLIEHSPALSAFSSPTVNSYKRTAAGGLVPDSARLGGDDREAYVRLPGGGPKAARVELRSGDAAANPYLLTAAALYAGLDGISRSLPSDAVKQVPRALDEAIDALEADDLLRHSLGPELVRVYAALKRGEWERFTNAVTDWEWNEYVYQA